jgi:hypothetical protein
MEAGTAEGAAVQRGKGKRIHAGCFSRTVRVHWQDHV